MIRIAYHACFEHHLPDGHRFPMAKYQLIPEQLLLRGIISEEQLFEPNLVDEETILLSHTHEYWHQLKSLSLDTSHIRRIGFPLNEQLILRERRIVQGTIDAALFALKNGSALNVAGGTHHAFTNKGEGFCLLNDFAVAANYLISQKLVKNILIIDLDVHQGNGTAQIFKNNANVFTFSMHGAHNYPFVKETSTLDVPLVDGIDDNTYLSTLKSNLDNIGASFKPDIVFYQSGVDILATDKYGKLNISEHGCYLRDKMVFKFCKDRNIPVTVAMGGGYSVKLSDIVNAHCNTFVAASELF